MIRRAVLLGRVSTSDKGQDPEHQLSALRAAAARMGWVVVEEIALNLSAWDAAAAAEVRRRALEPIEQGRADTLAIWAWDRYSREGIEAAFRELRHLEDHLGASLYSLQESFLSTATADKAQRELMLSIIAWSAKWESQRRSERLKAHAVTIRSRAANLGQRARWGGGLKGGDGGKLASAEDVARVHELRAQGLTVRAVAEKTGLSRSQVGRLVKASAE